MQEQEMEWKCIRTSVLKYRRRDAMRKGQDRTGIPLIFICVDGETIWGSSVGISFPEENHFNLTDPQAFQVSKESLIIQRFVVHYNLSISFLNDTKGDSLPGSKGIKSLQFSLFLRLFIYLQTFLSS